MLFTIEKIYKMKKLLIAIIMFLALGSTSFAQEKKKEVKEKVKKTSTIPQKVHNTFSKHKKYKGYKVKHKVENKKP